MNNKCWLFLLVLVALVSSCTPFTGVVQNPITPQIGSTETPIPSAPPTAPAIVEKQRNYQVWADSLNVRSGPGVEYPVVGYLWYGDFVTVYSYRNAQNGAIWGMISPNLWINMEYVK